MRGILVIISSIIVLLIVYIIAIKRQIKNINNQIKVRIDEKTRKPIETILFDKDLNNLVSGFNKVLHLEEKSRIEVINNEEKLKDMTANISHDLRTPITSIKGYLQLLNKSSLDNTQKQMLKTSLNHVDNLENLIDEFFELSYLEITKCEIDFKKINLTNLVSNTIVDYIYQFEEKNLQVEYKVERPMYVKGDEEKISRIIQNLIKNCLCHGISIVIVDIIEKENSVVLSFENEVLDSDEIDIEYLFDRFYIADKSRNGSSGLGLSIVKLLTEQMNGKAYAFLNNNKLKIEIEFKKY